MQAYIVSKINCAFCVKAKKLLEQHNIPYVEDIIGYHISVEQLQQKAPGVKTVPQIWLDEQYVGTFEDLRMKLAN